LLKRPLARGRTAKEIVSTKRPLLQAELPKDESPMTEFFSYALVPIAVIAVAVVLVFGLVNMMRGGSPQTSQKLMRLRVLMQFVAIIVIMIAVWAMGR
jgi:hypothetical protein